MFWLLFFNNYIEPAQLDASGFLYGHNLVGIKTPRSIRVGHFPLLHDYSVAFNHRLQNCKVSKLTMTQLLPAGLVARYVLALPGAGKPCLLIANAICGEQVN